jgi:hypothetical protein
LELKGAEAMKKIVGTLVLLILIVGMMFFGEYPKFCVNP